MELVGRRRVIGRALARILDRQAGRDDQHLAQAAVALGLEHHAGEAGVDRQPGQLPPDGGQPLALVAGARLERAQLEQQVDAVGDGPPIGWVEERERSDVAESDVRHLQDDRGQVRAEDLGVGELGPGVEVVLGVEPDADAVGHPAAPPGPLVGRCLRDPLDG